MNDVEYYDYAVDFDDTLAEYERPFDPWVVGKPKPGAIEWLTKQVGAGKRIVVHSCRANNIVGFQAIQDWLDDHLPADVSLAIDVWELKPLARRYIDDKAVRFEGWCDFEDPNESSGDNSYRVKCLQEHLAWLRIEPPEEAPEGSALEYQLHEFCHAYTLGILPIEGSFDEVIGTAIDRLPEPMQVFNEVLCNRLTEIMLERLGVQATCSIHIAEATQPGLGVECANALANEDLFGMAEQILESLVGAGREGETP